MTELRNVEQDLSRFRGRVLAASAIILVCFILLIARLVYLQILPLFIASHAVSLVVRLLSSGSFPGWTLLLAPLFEAMLWPVATLLLLAPQRRAPDRDEQRPL